MTQRANAKRIRLTIGKLAARAAVNIETVRYYERIGLLPSPPRTEGGHRMYEELHLRRLAFVRRARDLGFALDDVRALLQLAEERSPTCARARALATQHLTDVRGKIADLRRIERALTQTVALCETGELADCPLLAALYRERPAEH